MARKEFIMSRRSESAQTQTQTQAAPQTTTESELISLALAPQVSWTNTAGIARRGVRVHSVSLLNDDPSKRPVFGGLLGELTDPSTGEVRGRNRDSVALNFFGTGAEALAEAITSQTCAAQGGRIFDPKRDAVALAFADPEAPGLGSAYRLEDGSLKSLAVGSREFPGVFKILWASAPIAPVAE